VRYYGRFADPESPKHCAVEVAIRGELGQVNRRLCRGKRTHGLFCWQHYKFVKDGRGAMLSVPPEQVA